MGRLFGTDGARGIANSELTCELAMNIGRAAAYVLTKHTESRPKIMIGKDTRVSSTMLEMALASGLCSVGADVVLVGFVPTPAIAYLVASTGTDCGIMISASHNPCEYNGIKLFDRNGYKLPDSIENEIEEIVLDKKIELNYPIGGGVGNVFNRPDYVNKYINHVVFSIDNRLDGMKIAIDCANGCASETAEKIFTQLGAECFVIHDRPNGVNINAKCGSTHLDDLIDFVNANQVDLGLAFDGDSDRCLAVDENGKVIDGDKLIAVFAKELKETGKLTNNAAVVTVMTNMGFKEFAKNNDINVVETAVGDRYVLEEMLKNDYQIGGEQSGHIIFKQHATTGDGQLSGVQFASAMARTGLSASKLAAVMETYPQVLLNVTADNKAKEIYSNSKEIKDYIEKINNNFNGTGRILVRVSGTEPLIRIMLEGKDIHEINRIAKEVAGFIKDIIKNERSK